MTKALQGEKFSHTIIERTESVLDELITNVYRHVHSSQAFVGLEINTQHLPQITVKVADEGNGYDVLSTLTDEWLAMKSGGPEHGLARIYRLSDLIDIDKAETNRSFTIFCTLYDVAWPGSVCDDFSGYGKIIMDYHRPYSIWFGERRYPLWWHYPSYGYVGFGATQALDFALDHRIEKMFDLYLADLFKPRYLFFEIQGHGPTEAANAGRRSSIETIIETLETYFAQYFMRRRVFLFTLEHRDELKRLASKYRLKLFTSKNGCLRELRSISKGES